uniref:Putative secreted protein n=1 Tax=Ixodes ricinus TaxID=34613 RepID=A0A147BF10_IXORI
MFFPKRFKIVFFCFFFAMSDIKEQHAAVKFCFRKNCRKLVMSQRACKEDANKKSHVYVCFSWLALRPVNY